MSRYPLQRTLATVPVIVFTSIIVFAIMRILPGDPIIIIAGEAQSDISPQVLQQLRRDNNLDKPVYVQYVLWVEKLALGDFGRSIRSRQPIGDILKPRLLPTLQIGLLAWIAALLIAVPAGLVSALRPNSWADWLGTLGALIGAAMPYFLLGGVLIYAVALRLRWLPASGYVSPLVDPVQSFKVCIMPAITLGAGLAAVTMRQVRSSLVGVLRQPYVVTARAKGLSEGTVVLRHAFKNGMLPVVTILGIQLGNLFGGAVITETIFAVPGVGRLLVESIFSRDYGIVQAVVLLISLAVVLSNLAVDLAYGLLDPRIRLA